MRTPKITVLMTVYNSEKYINQAIDSLLNQTISDFELLIIDDGSTDKSISLIKQYDDARINLIEKENNTGLIDSLNLGLKLAKGKYIARMDSDDVSLPNRFEKQLVILENKPDIKVCGCWLKTFEGKEEFIKHKENHNEIVANMLLHCSMSMCSVMFEREALKGYQFDKDKVHVEDYDFWSRVAWSSKFYNIQEVLYLYRIHDSQVSTVYKETQILGDVAIKLFLLKKINYDISYYPDEFISKMLLLNHSLGVDEFVHFNKWIKNLINLNKEHKVYHQKYLEKVLTFLKEKLFYKIYFTNSVPGITKKWRWKSLLKLNAKDAVWVLNIKKREMFKSLFR